MKIKRFNENINKPELNDYVIIDLNTNNYDIKNYLINNIGKIYRVNNKPFKYTAVYLIPENNLNKFIYHTHVFGDNPGLIKGNEYFINIKTKEIIYWSKNKEDLEIILTAKNFNL